MAGYDRQIISGDPGAVWVNDTDKPRYQFVASLVFTCGACLQYHLKIGPFWPIPIHHQCRCRQLVVAVGAEAPHPFCDYRALLDRMPTDQQKAAVGASNWRLLQSGVVDWKDVVTPARVRDFREVVALKKLSVKTLVDAGVKPIFAEAAHAAVNTPAHQLVAQQRAQQLASLQAAGFSQEDLARELAKRLGARVSLQSVPTLAGATTVSGLAGAGGSTAAQLKKLLILPTIAAMGPKPKPKEPKPPEAEPPAAATVPAPGPPGPPPGGPAAVAAPAPKTAAPAPAPKGVFAGHSFGPSAKIKGTFAGDSAKVAEKLFGRKVSAAEIASISGAPDGARVRMRVDGDGSLRVDVEHKTIEVMTRTIRRENGRLVIHNDIFKLHAPYQDTPEKLGLRAFARQAENAHKAGVSHIETNAFRVKGDTYLDANGKEKEKWIGYYVWPSYGYDGPLRQSTRDALMADPDLPMRLKAAKNVSQLMAEPEGVAWWRKNGVPIDVEFDLKAGSYSLDKLDKYLQERLK